MEDLSDLFWKKKLKAFLHDPPVKCLDLANHEEIARQFMRSIGFTDEEWTDPAVRQSDILAASADRFPFPKPSCCTSKFDFSSHNPFRHPFCESSFASEPLSSELAEQELQSSIYIVGENLSWKKRFFLYWRRWADEASKQDSRLAFLPADSRIPDHTIWNHISMASAFRACLDDSGNENASFLLFQIGPVQEFIEQARSTKDCWSGSYLLSWLMSKALAVLADEIGPDNVIFPSLRNQAFLDLAMKEIYKEIPLGHGRTLWDIIREESLEDRLKIPTIPNRTLVLLPFERAEELAGKAEQAIQHEWRKIVEFSWKSFQSECGCNLQPWSSLWNTQTNAFLKIYYQIMPWDSSLKNCSLEELLTAIPASQRDPRYFRSPECSELAISGYTWSRQYRRTEKAFAARKALRNFQQFSVGPLSQKGLPKDMLSGKEECIGPEEIWKNPGKLAHFKENEGPYGAISIIKRFFPDYLRENNDLNMIPGRIPSTQEIAADRRYFAVIALDGDAIGKRLSGENARTMGELFSPEGREYFSAYPKILARKRDLTPSGHIQFSECLSNFALNLVKPVFDAFGGFLIYAGGDDVLGMVPARNALKTALALRMMFRGEESSLIPKTLFRGYEFRNGWVFQNGRPLMVPGIDCEVSCGIAVTHEKYPLQRAIREARDAERRAKKEYGRSAFAVSLLKRGGEIIHWGGKWKSPAIELFYRYQDASEKGEVGARFPYILAQTLQAYRLERDQNGTLPPSELERILAAEFRNLASRQWQGDVPENLVSDYLRCLRQGYRTDSDTQQTAFEDFANLFLSVAFIHRDVLDREEEE